MAASETPNETLVRPANVRIADFGPSAWLIVAAATGERAQHRLCWDALLGELAPEVVEQVDGCVSGADPEAGHAKLASTKVLLMTIQEDLPSVQ